MMKHLAQVQRGSGLPDMVEADEVERTALGAANG